jgi:hypothetical protein
MHCIYKAGFSSSSVAAAILNLEMQNVIVRCREDVQITLVC